jgi:hypothetical protein
VSVRAVQVALQEGEDGTHLVKQEEVIGIR